MYNRVGWRNTDCRGQSSWRTTERRTFQSPGRQSSERPKRLCPGCLRRSPDRLSRRTQTASFSGKSKQWKIQESEPLTTDTETGQQTQYHHDFSDLLPLLLCGVCAGGVMGTGMEHEDGTFWTTLQEPDEEEETLWKTTNNLNQWQNSDEFLPPGHQETQPGPDLCWLRPSTCRDELLQNQRWRKQRCDFLK